MPSQTQQDVRLSFLQYLAEGDSGRQDAYTAYREYYDGDHDTQLTKRLRAFLQVKIGQEFNDNYCPIVVDALVERLTVTGFDAGETQGEQVWDWWTQNRMDGGQGVAHLSAVRDGDAYLIVEWDNEEKRPVFIPELAYDGSEGVKIHYSKERRDVVEFASKRWRVESGDDTGKMRRLNLYYPDRIEKYASHDDAFEGAWQPFEEPGQPWPIPWVGIVPVIHFKNREQGYHYGQSELKDVIPLQNALNKSIIDLLGAADITAFRTYWATGDDPSGLEISPGSWIYSLKPPGEVEFGVFSGEDLAPLIALKDTFVTEIARVSRTPLSYFQVTGAVSAEGTQKQQESGLVARAKNRQVSFGNAWEDAMILARRLWNEFGPGGMDEAQPISCQWQDPQTRNEKEHLETLTLKAGLGVPEETLWSEMGYSAEQIATMAAQRGEERAASSNFGGELLREFERGGVE